MSESELVAVDNSTAPSLANQFDIVDVEGAKAFMDNYQELVKALLDNEDYQKIGANSKKKKSAWRKLATAFNISDEVVSEELKFDDDDNQIISARYKVRATLPNGRSTIGVGSCSIYDKIRYNATPKHPADKETPSNFELRGRFSNAEHDVPSTAHTRAKNRAISDLIGAGEVSAEEMSATGKSKKSVKPIAPKPSKPQSKVPNSSTMGNKPKAPKAPSKPKPDIDDEAIDVEYVEPKTPSKPNLATIIKSNKHVRMAVDELQAQETTVDRPHIQDKLLDLMDMGKVTAEEYQEAKTLLE